MKHRDKTLYRATLSGLKLNAFGIDQTIDYTGEVEIYQARANPELWRARPMFKHGAHAWEAGSGYELMQLINRDFVAIVKPWCEFRANGTTLPWPTLLPAGKNRQTRTGS